MEAKSFGPPVPEIEPDLPPVSVGWRERFSRFWMFFMSHIPHVVTFGGVAVLGGVWVAIAFAGDGTGKFWEWDSTSWQSVAVAVTGWMLAIFSSLTWWSMRNQETLRHQELLSRQRNEAIVEVTELNLLVNMRVDRLNMALYTYQNLARRSGIVSDQQIDEAKAQVDLLASQGNDLIEVLVQVRAKLEDADIDSLAPSYEALITKLLVDIKTTKLETQAFMASITSALADLERILRDSGI